nr:phage tail length tape measure family protein [Brucella intermedia]
MAVTADKVVVELEADVNAYLTKTAQAQQQGVARMQAIGDSATAMGNASTAGFNKAASAAESSSASLKKAGVSAGMAQQQVRNLAFQMQDVGTMMASGQSPFTLLAQQLPQITMYGGSLNGVMGALKSTVAGLISPLGLATTAFVLLGSAAISYFDELFTSGSKSEEQLKKEAQLVQEVVDKWGDALPALKAYNDERRRAEDNKKVQDATADEVAKQWADLRDQIDGFTVQYADLMSQLQMGGAPVEDVDRLRKAFFNLKGNIEAGTATQKDYQAVTESLSSLLNSTSIPAIDSFASAISALIGPLYEAARATAELNKQSDMKTGKAPFEDYAARMIEGFDELSKKTDEFTANAAKRNAMSKDQLDVENEIARVRSEADKAGAVLTEKQLRDLAQQNVEADKRRSAEESARRKAEREANRKPRKPRESDLERTSRSFSDRTATTVAETEALRQLDATVEDYGYTLAKARAEQALMNAAQKDGKALTPEMRENIGQIADEYARATAEANQLAEAQDKIRQRSEEWQDLAKDATRGIVDDLIAGKSAADAFSNALGRIAQKLLDMAFDDLFTGLFKGGGGGGFLGGLIPGFATGTNYAPGGLAIVGERGPELVNLPRGAQVIPNHKLTAPTLPSIQGVRQSASSGAMRVDVGVSVDNDGNLQAYVQNVSRKTSQSAIRSYDKTGPARLKRDSRQANMRGMV